jgi:exodeoxyribonuclease VII small subunit
MSDTENTLPPAAPRSLDKISFEDALGELERIVASLERGEVSLDDAIKAFERGTELKSHCQARLEEARMRVEKIKLPSAGEAPDAATPFDPSVG